MYNYNHILLLAELEKQINALEKRILFEINKIAKTVLETQPQQKFFIARQDRAAEIAGLNMTAQREGSSALTFNYFWKIDNILSVISSSGAFAEESADFHFAGKGEALETRANYNDYILGHHLRLSLFSAQESNSKYYEQQLFAKMIRMREEVNYALPHQLILVNQVDKNLDRASDILYCGTTDTFYSACASYQFSADILQSSEFIQDDDSLIIRLLIHLNYQ